MRKEDGSGVKKIPLSGVIGSSEGEIFGSNVIPGIYKDDISFTLFNPYTKGMYTIMKIKLKYNYPHIVLDSLNNDAFLSKIGKFFNKESRIQLEGNFDSTFKVYSKAPAHDTLRILSTDTMALLLDIGSNFDIEIIEDNLHIVSRFKFANEKNIKQFFIVADTLMDKLDRRSTAKVSSFDTFSRVE